MRFDKISTVWCNLDKGSKVVIVTESARLELAERIKEENEELVAKIDVVNLDFQEYEEIIKALSEQDLIMVLLTIDGFINKNYRNTFPPFLKPHGVSSKYVFIRLDIPEGALLTGLNTDFNKVEDIIEELRPLCKDTRVRVTTPNGTDIVTSIKGQIVLPYHTHTTGSNAFLPPAEVSESLYETSTNGRIVVDATLGELRINGEIIDKFGIVDEPVIVVVKDGLVEEVFGGEYGERLKQGLNLIPKHQQIAVELGHGLSDITPTGIIGVDESMNGTCHFGIGNGDPFHLDLVVYSPEITIL